MNPTIEDILFHDRWLRRTALALTQDAGEADDLVQDAWVSGLEQQRTAEEDRPWFRGLLWNRLAGFKRSRAYARAKATRYAEERDRLGEATDDLAEARELQQLVARELLALQEPLRQAVYLRFIAGLSNAEVARETGVAESTVSQRISRGLEELRRKLDASVAGGRSAWAPALLHLALPPETAFVSTGSLTVAGAAAGALLCAAAVTVVLRSGSPGAGPLEVLPIERSGDPVRVAEESMDVREEEWSVDPRSALPVHSMSSRSRRGRRRDDAPPPAVVLESSVGEVGHTPVRAEQAPALEETPVPEVSDDAITVDIAEPLLFHSLGAPLKEAHIRLVSTASSRAFESPTWVRRDSGLGSPFDALFNDPAPGLHRVEISDPRFDLFTSKVLEPGDRASVRLVGSASIILGVEAPGGLYPTELEVTLTHKEICSTESSYVATLHGQLIDDLVPWSYTLTARSLEGTATVDVDDLAPTESRVVNVELLPCGRVTGWVRSPSGHPVSGALVRLVRFEGKHYPRTEVAEVGELWCPSPGRVAVEESPTGPQGEFSLEVEREGHYVVLVGRAGAPQVESEPMDIAQSEVVDALDLVLDPGGRVIGQINGATKQQLIGSKVVVYDPEGKSTPPMVRQSHAVSADGRFELGPLPAGKFSIFWYEAGNTKFQAATGGVPSAGQYIGQADVIDGETVQVPFTLSF